MGMVDMAPQSGTPSLDLFFYLFGCSIALSVLLRTSWKFWFKVRIHILSEFWKGVDFSHYGTWAVVTGATSGIGKGYAHELAKKGLNVVLVSRSMEKLKQVAAEIEELYGRSTKVIQVDFTGGSEIYESIQEGLRGLEIGVLVNNVGMSHMAPSDFLQIPDTKKYINDVVNCNVLSTLKWLSGGLYCMFLEIHICQKEMTEAILPQMVARKKGIVINISSGSAIRPLPLAAMYSASKAFVDLFSRALNVEYRSKGIIVQSILPMAVDTNMTKRVRARAALMSPEVYAHRALNTVGFTNRTSGCLSHSLQHAMVDWFVPSFFLHTSYGMWMHRSTANSIFK